MHGFISSANRKEFLLHEAIEIAMPYLEKKGVARRAFDVEVLVTAEIRRAWSQGLRHKIALANVGIAAAERRAEALPTVFPKFW